ncbi:MAG TPA: hypothetical protein H9695_01165 [Candidatus Mediterraneibacter excrementigallinarum]|nr:hypothetical protein [Candidatus Mediterraneibacter excrementigallinarum]
MTENEAISRIKDHMEIHRLKEPRAIYITVALSMAITALKEIQQYREIGTVKECREAVEKQKVKKPLPINYKKYADKIENAEFLEDSYFCPNCKIALRSGSYCNRCGQKLNWNENLEEMEDERD